MGYEPVKIDELSYADSIVFTLLPIRAVRWARTQQ
jgi:hypothetical protein